MSALDSLPNTQNSLSPVGFQFKAARLPSVVFFSQKVSIPALSLQPIKIGNPFNKLNFVGDHLEFGTFNVNFKIDEKMQNYFEIYDWMIACGFPDNYDQYKTISSKSKADGDWIMSDASTIIFDAQNNPIISLDYKNVFPINLKADEFDARDTNISYMNAVATFVCESYSFKIL